MKTEPTVTGGAGAASHELKVGEWIVDPERNEVRRGGEALRLEPKVVEVLLYLARRAGRVVGREELLSAVWAGVVVGDDALTQAIIKLRKALGDDAHQPRYIETISKRGYRLIAPVQGAGSVAADTGGATGRARRTRLLALLPVVAVIVVVVVAFAFPALLKSVGMPWPIGADTRGSVKASLPVIAVLPLSNLSGDPRRDYFSDGVTEDLIDALGRFAGLRVMSRNAVQGYKGKTLTPQAIRSELGARYIVKGSVREAEGKVRVAVELSDADEGTQLWSERYDADAAQVLEIQDRIARNIAGALAVKLTRIEEQRVATRPTGDAQVYDLLLRARALIRRQDRASNREARTLLVQAEKLAPDHADTLTDQCRAEFQRAMFGWIEDVAAGAKRAEELCTRALASPDQRAHSRAHAALASIYSNQNRFEESLRAAERAIELNASDSTALYRRGATLLYAAGRIDEAIATMEAARRFEPHSFDGLNLAVAYYVTGRYAEALAQVDAIRTHVPHDPGLHALRAATLAQLGNAAEAQREVAEVLRLSPTFRLEFYGNRFANPEHTAKLQAGLRKAGL